MRLMVWLLLGLGAAVLTLVLLSWLAERSLDRIATPFMVAGPDRLPTLDVALVLGAAPIGPEGGPNKYLEYRLDSAAALWRAGKVKFLLVSGNEEGPEYDEPGAMRRGLMARMVPAEAIYRDPAGFRTYESVLRARDVFGQKRLVIVSQRFHLARAIYLARQEGVEAWGLEARDVDRAYSILTELRRYPSALRAYWDAWRPAAPRHHEKPVVMGVDPPA